MPRIATLSVILSGGVLIAACGMADETSGDAGEPRATAEGGLECYTRGSAEEAAQRPSPLTRVAFTFTGGEGLLCYGAPAAAGRAIMDGLVPYGQPWRIGANEPTTLHLSAPAVVGGVALEPGSYSLYAVPDAEEWRFIVNASWERWGIPIDAAVRASDIGSFTARPEPTSEMVERLTYDWEPMEGGAMGNLVLEWENTRVPFHVHPPNG